MALGLRRVRFSTPPSFRRGVAVLAGGAALGQLAILAVSPIITRLYSPTAFGAFGIYLALLTILVSVAALRYELAIPLPEDEETASSLLGVNVLALFATAAATAIAVAIAGDWITETTNTPDLEPFLWLLPVGIFAGGLYQSLSFWAIRRKRLGIIARTRVWQGVSQAITQVGVGVFRSDPLGLILGSILGRAAGTTTLARLLRAEGAFVRSAFRLQEIRRTARRYRRFPLISTWSALLNSSGLQAPVLLLGAFYGPVVVGWFALTQRVIGLPMTLLGQAVSQAYIGEAAVLARTDPRRLESVFLRAARDLALVGVVPLVITVFLGPWLFGLVFGSEWTEAGSYARVLAVMFLAQFVTGPLAQTLNIFEQLHIQLYSDASRVVLGLGAIVVADLAGLSALAAIALFSGAMTLAYLMNFALGLHQIRRAQLTERPAAPLPS